MERLMIGSCLDWLLMCQASYYSIDLHTCSVLVTVHTVSFP